ncbi:hypothetical protein [Proteiniborus sp. MB09-C3]|uniref:hypothetical protein n=1 Tax=Proteiniborus sp. MB09-C3 TaxID=3050072 RepID=UPI002553F915|nr:hypothetical protein [Proteiniborus sp. MB09-C3]WIV13660.1 hypothetical protein QO263_08160 [Proteiniborus sp. MB09-C3]
MYTCAMCSENYCKKRELEKLPRNCPCSEKEEQEKIKKLYIDKQVQKINYL